MSKQSALYSEKHARSVNLSLDSLGIPSWSAEDVSSLQIKVGAKPVDGWFGPKSVKAFKTWKRKHAPVFVHCTPSTLVRPGQAVINGKGHTPPAGLKLVNHIEEGGIPAQLGDTAERKRPVTQFILHRGWAGGYKPGRNFAAKTEETLDARGLSSSFSMDIDGTIYQHFDVGTRRGRHATYHNVQSDSLDIGGPFSWGRKPAPGQEKFVLKMAIGRTKDTKPPLARAYGTVKCWSLTPEQEQAVLLFVPWWCELRGIPMRACSDWRSMRVGGLGLEDPVTGVTGILAHMQVSGPGRRVDGVLPLIALEESDVDIEWRPSKKFFDRFVLRQAILE